MASGPGWEHTGRTVRAEIAIRATPAQVWSAWSDPRTLSQWFTDDATGSAVVGEQMTWIFERFRLEIPYTVVEVVENQRLVLSATGDARPYVLELEITSTGSETVLRLTNSGLSDDPDRDDEFEDIRSGWEMALGVLKLYSEKYYGEDRTPFLAVREAEFEFADVFPYYSDADRMTTWLTTEGHTGQQGEHARLILRDGRSLTGRVLVVTGREVTLEWSEIRGVLELKAFAYGADKRALCIRGAAWGLDPDEAPYIENSLAASLERLVAQLES